MRRSRRRVWLASIGTFAVLGACIAVACGVDAVGDELTASESSGDSSSDRASPSLPDGSTVPVGDGSTSDADATPDADPCTLCAGEGGTCRFADGGDGGDGGDTCAITCSGKGGCQNVVCPPGIACEVDCKDEATCKNVDCTTASRCTIGCGGKLACENVTCAGSTCTLNCLGEGACGADGGRAFCRATQGCNVACIGKGSCSFLICQSNQCRIDCEGDDSCRTARARGGDTDASCATKACDEIDCTGTSCNLTCADSPEACDRICCDAGTCTGAAADASASPTKCVTK